MKIILTIPEIKIEFKMQDAGCSGAEVETLIRAKDQGFRYPTITPDQPDRPDQPD